MDYSSAFAISAIGMDVERARVDVAALNLANANTVQPVGGTAYQPLRVVAQARSPLDAAGGSFESLLQRAASSAMPLPPAVSVVPMNVAPRMVHEPGHPLADEKGFVAYAAVDAATEMVSLMGATRAYEANVAAMNISRTLALRALDIGSQNA